MRTRPVIVALVGVLIAAGSSLACVPDLPENTSAINEGFARNLVASAVYVDVATAESAQPVDKRAFHDAWLRHQLTQARNNAERQVARKVHAARLREPTPAYRVVYRVTKRLKGRSSDRFELRTANFRSGRRPVEPLRHQKLPNGSILPCGSPPEAAPTLERVDSPCFTHIAIEAAKGETYLIFRDSAGRLLGPTLSQRPGGPAKTRSYVYQAVRGTGDPWLRAVERASAR